MEVDTRQQTYQNESQEAERGGAIGGRLRPCLLVGLLLFVALLVYFPAINGSFIWDDYALIPNNSLITAPSGLMRIWFTTEPVDYWPLTYTSLWIDWQLWGESTTGYHLANIFLHGVNSILVWIILARLKIPGAYFAALLFAVHPVNIASVAWIVQRKSTLSLLLYLVSILYYLKFSFDRRAVWYLSSLIAFAFSLLAKTSSVMLPFILLGCAWWERGRITRKDVVHSLPYFAIAFVLGAIAFWFKTHRSIGDDFVRDDGFLSRLAVAGSVVWFYLSKALWPVNLSFIYPRWQSPDTRSLLTFLPLIVLIVCGAVVWRYRNQWSRPGWFAFAFYVINLIPVLGFFNIYFMRYSLVADHWQYTSMIAVVTLVAAGVTTLSAKTGSSLFRFAVAGALVVVLGALTWSQSSIYSDEITIWRDTVEKNPKAWVAHNALGIELMKTNDLVAAENHFKEAISIKPDFVEARNNLGNAMQRAGRIDEAIAQYERVLRQAPQYADAHNNLGFTLQARGRFREAVKHYKEAVRLKPDLVNAYGNLGLVLQELWRFEEAVTQFEKALKLQPDNARFHRNLADGLQRLTRFEEATLHYQEALKLNPNFVAVHNALGNALQALGRFDESAEHYREALRLNPDNAGVRYNLGFALQELGRWKEAEVQYREAIGLEPESAQIYNNLGKVYTHLNQYDLAINHYSRAIEIRADYADARYNRAAIYRSRKEFQLALKDFDLLVQQNPKRAIIRFDRGEVYQQIGAHEAALDDFNRAIDLKPDFAAALVSRAESHARLGRYEVALTDYETAIELRPTSMTVHNNAAWLLATCPDLRVRNAEEAIRHAERACELSDWKDYGMLDTLAVAYAAKGDFTTAAKWQKKAIKRAPEDAKAELETRFELYKLGKPFQNETGKQRARHDSRSAP